MCQSEQKEYPSILLSICSSETTFSEWFPLKHKNIVISHSKLVIHGTLELFKTFKKKIHQLRVTRSTGSYHIKTKHSNIKEDFRCKWEVKKKKVKGHCVDFLGFTHFPLKQHLAKWMIFSFGLCSGSYLWLTLCEAASRLPDHSPLRHKHEVWWFWTVSVSVQSLSAH